MALTLNLTQEQLASELSKAAFKAIEAEINRQLFERVKPIVEEAARIAAAGLKPAILSISRDHMSDQINVQLVLNHEIETIK